MREEYRKCGDCSYEASDGVQLYFDAYEVPGNLEETSTSRDLVFLHGWSGSSRYYSPAVCAFLEDGELLRRSGVGRVYVLDIRGHGRSLYKERCTVARLAQDLKDFITKVTSDRRARLCCLGSSMGAAILWSYCEQFQNEGIASAVFIDQAPLQYERDDWRDGSKGLRTPEDLAGLRKALKEDMAGFAAGNADCCLVDPQKMEKELIETITKETLKCDPNFLGELMADHTALDWRGVLKEKYSIPVLNLAGGKSGVFPVQGVAAINELLGSRCPHKLEVFEDCSHWLYIERPKKFMRVVIDWLAGQQ